MLQTETVTSLVSKCHWGFGWTNTTTTLLQKRGIMSKTAKVSSTITFAVVSCHHAHPRHNEKLHSRLSALGYAKLIQVECDRYMKSVNTQSTPRCITCVSRLKRLLYIKSNARCTSSEYTSYASNVYAAYTHTRITCV